MNIFVVATTLVLLYVTVDSVHAIKCYSCLTAEDKDCRSKDQQVLKKYERDCSLSYHPGHMKFGRCAISTGYGVVSRSCYFSFPDAPAKRCSPSPDAHGNGQLCICSGDLCNTMDLVGQ